MINSRFIHVFLSFFLLMTITDLAGSEPTETIGVGIEKVEVLAEPETLIVGVDVDKLMKRHLPDYDLFYRSSMGPGADGILFRWRIRNWSTPRDRKFVRMSVGVFSSHREALLAADRYLRTMAAVLMLVPRSPDDPTYLAWNIPGSGDVPGTFVRDNALITIQVADELDPPAFIKAIDTDLKEGAEGVLKGTKVEPPTIVDPGFPSSFSPKKGDKAVASLGVSDPNDRPTYRRMWVHEFQIPHSWLNRIFYMIFSRPEQPRVAWYDTDEVVIEPHGGPITVELHAIAANDLCVVSHVWSKSFQLSIK